MRELSRVDGKEDYFFYYSLEYYDPLLDYVTLFAEKHEPVNELDYEAGHFISSAIGTFALRYFENKIDKGGLERYLKTKEVLDTIEAFGYDVEKFWY